MDKQSDSLDISEANTSRKKSKNERQTGMQYTSQVLDKTIDKLYKYETSKVIAKESAGGEVRRKSSIQFPHDSEAI